MTIAAAYLTSEGVVFGADSATMITIQPPGGPPTVGQVLRHSQKVFEVGEASRIGLCTWGGGGIGETSHRTIVAQLADRLDDDTPVAVAVERLLDLVREAREDATPPLGAVGYFVGGWDPGAHLPQCFELRVDDGGEIKRESLNRGEARFSGAPQFFSRVFWGYDQRLREGLSRSLRRKMEGLATDFDARFQSAFDEAAAPLAAAGFKDLPIREAIDYVHTFLHITVKMYKFVFGVPVCGGPIEIGFVSTDRTFRWVCHKAFDSAIRDEEV